MKKKISLQLINVPRLILNQLHKVHRLWQNKGGVFKKTKRGCRTLCLCLLSPCENNNKMIPTSLQIPQNIRKLAAQSGVNVNELCSSSKICWRIGTRTDGWKLRPRQNKKQPQNTVSVYAARRGRRTIYTLASSYCHLATREERSWMGFLVSVQIPGILLVT